MTAITGNRSIFVVDSGWVFLCENWERDGHSYHLKDSNVIRVWGTTAGLGQIALKGPTKETILDYCGNPSVPENKVIVVIPCTYTPKSK